MSQIRSNKGILPAPDLFRAIFNPANVLRASKLTARRTRCSPICCGSIGPALCSLAQGTVIWGHHYCTSGSLPRIKLWSVSDTHRIQSVHLSVNTHYSEGVRTRDEHSMESWRGQSVTRGKAPLKQQDPHNELHTVPLQKDAHSEHTVQRDKNRHLPFNEMTTSHTLKISTWGRLNQNDHVYVLFWTKNWCSQSLEILHFKYELTALLKVTDRQFRRGIPFRTRCEKFSLEELLQRKLVSLKTVSTKIKKKLGCRFRKDPRLLAKHTHHQLHSAVLDRDVNLPRWMQFAYSWWKFPWFSFAFSKKFMDLSSELVNNESSVSVSDIQLKTWTNRSSL